MHDQLANQSQNTTMMMNKWASQITRTRKARQSDSTTDTEDDKDLDAPVVDDVGSIPPAEIKEGEIGERILIDESPATATKNDFPATADLSPDLEFCHHVDEGFPTTTGGSY